MNVQFDYTPDELAEVLERTVQRSKTVRSSFWKGLMWNVLTVAWLPFLLTQQSLYTKTITSLVLMAVCALIYVPLYHNGQKRRLKKLSLEHFGSDKTITLQVEITPAGIRTRQRHTETFTEWEDVEEITERPDSVDFSLKPNCLTVVRKRAFASQEELKQFISTAREFFEASKRK